MQSTPSAGIDKNTCSKDNILACKLTRNALWEGSVASELRRLIGERQAGWLYDGGMADQVIDVLNGPDPDPPVRFGDNLIRYSACRWHSCEEKGAVVLTTEGEIVSAGVIHFDVSRNYSNDRMLTILTRNRNEHFQEVVDHLFAWYEKVTIDYNESMIKLYGRAKAWDDLRTIRDPEIIHFKP